MKKNILITYTNTGAGHIIPALAIAQRIEELYPNQFNVTSSNFFEDVGETKFNRYIEESWNFLLKNPHLTKAILILGKVLHKISPYYVKIFHNKVWINSIEYMKSINPDIVISTHFFTYNIAIDAKKKYQLTFPIIGFNPDTFETFPQWSHKGDLFLVCSELAKKSALAFGHQEQKMQVVSQVLRKEFRESTVVDKIQLKQQWGLREGVFTILMSDGGQGIGKMSQSIDQLLKMDVPLNIIAICGKNNKLYKKLLNKQTLLKNQNHAIQLYPQGFIDNITSFIHMSDLFIGKSGPATVIECLKLNLPFLVNFSANSAERKTASFFITQKVLLSCTTISLLSKKVKKIINTPSILLDIKERLAMMDFFQDGSDKIVNIIVDSINNKNSA